MCAKNNKPVMIHLSDSYGRFLPIGPENERYEAGLWRSSPEGNYYHTGHPTHEVIEKARENMHAKHPKTRFVNAHMAMLYYDMDKVAALLDKFPNADVELSATVQDLGRAPLMIRKFFLKYQDRILFGTDGNPARGIEEFWVPHWRFLETFDEHFDHPAQLRSATGPPGPRVKGSLPRHDTFRGWTAPLLFASTTINYIDRQTLSVLAPYLKRDFAWSNSDFALIVIAFRAAYTIFQLLSGRLLDRLGTRRGLSLAVLWYSSVAIATSAAMGLKSFAAFRFLLGAGE